MSNIVIKAEGLGKKDLIGTLIKILSRIMEPSTGRVTIRMTSHALWPNYDHPTEEG